ncbi:ribonuclease T2 family protein [Ferrimonas pelagia]|uniref:Ribonuclease T2 family n=1 Tax=Ferrimonas pelagia TaxID=1177826 RepID=A0ABP9FAA7_9GAMM
MRHLIVLVSLVFAQTGWAQVPATGELTIQTPCPAFQSIRRQSNPGDRFVAVGQTLILHAENRPDGDWWLVQLGNERRWVAKSCGTVEGETWQREAEPELRSEPADGSAFAHYTLAMSWHPGFCEGKGKRPDCRNARPELVLHGLWPSNAKAPHPAYCDGSDRRSFCRYPSLSLADQQLSSLRRVMPGVDVCLQRYQWHKHGSCAGLSRADYFERSIAYSLWLKESEPARQLRRHAGARLSRQQVLTWFDHWGAKGAVTLHCRNGALEEVRLRLSPQLPAQPELSRFAPARLQQSCPSFFDLLP